VTGRLPYRYVAGLDLDEITARVMGEVAALWFAQRTDGRRSFICGAGLRGEPLIAVLVTDVGEDPYIFIRPAALDEMLQRHFGNMGGDLAAPTVADGLPFRIGSK
jgi:hypothetical protein